MFYTMAWNTSNILDQVGRCVNRCHYFGGLSLANTGRASSASWEGRGSKAQGDRFGGIHKYLYKLLLCTVLTSRAPWLLLYRLSKAFCVKPGGASLELRDARATLKLLDDCRRSL